MVNFLNQIVGVPLAFAQAGAADKTGSSTFNVVGFVLDNLPLWITAIVVMIISLVVGVVLKNIVESRLAAKMSDEHQELLIISGRLTFVVVSVIGGCIALTIAGINVTNLIAAIGFGISFGLQDTISNFVAGLALLAARPFSIGDWIKINGRTGKVTEIRSRATYLTTYDGLRLIVPNASLYKSSVVSYTSNPIRRLKVPIYCRYLANLKDVVTIAKKVIKADPRIFLEPKPSVVLVDFADYYVYLELRFWVDSKSLWRRIASEAALEIQKRLEEAGLDSPYPVTALEFDEDAEGVVLQHKNVDANEFNQILKDREASKQEFDKRRMAMIVEKARETDAKAIVDASGAQFLRTEQIINTLKTVENTEQQQLGQQAQPAQAPSQQPDQPAPNTPPANQSPGTPQ